MKKIVALLLCASLAACGTPSLFRIDMTKKAAPAPAAAPVAPICPGSLRADLEDEPDLPPNAGFPAPADAAATAAVKAYLTWLHDLAVWGRAGWDRAANAKTFCDGHS